jgi:hypothetical protein
MVFVFYLNENLRSENVSETSSMLVIVFYKHCPSPSRVYCIFAKSTNSNFPINYYNSNI